jgi:exonuclease VII small subunit
VPQDKSLKLDLEEAFERFRQGVEVYAQKLQTIAENAKPFLMAIAEIDWAAIMRRLDELPAKSKAAMSLASSKGWFFGWHDSLRSLMELVAKLEVTRPTDIDEVMASYYRANFEPFTDELAKNHPNRAPVIKAAARAHTTLGSDGYFLSIPVFIAQADGLLTEITEVQSAMMKDRGGQELQGSKVLREKLAANPAALDLIHPLLNLHDSDFMKSAAARQRVEEASGEVFTALNRHQVMHGESWDYGTEINSLKAFSLLVHVGSHLPIVLERAPTP